MRRTFMKKIKMMTPANSLLVSVIILPVILLASTTIQADSAKGIKDDSLGLSKTSVNDTPAPEKFHYAESFPGTGSVLPRSYEGAPPQIPHNIEAFIPITASNNMCKQCHNTPDMIGKKVKGMPTPIPASHYTDRRFSPDKMGKEVVGVRTVCTQCHVPQANVKPLVDNTFSSH